MLPTRLSQFPSLWVISYTSNWRVATLIQLHQSARKAVRRRLTILQFFKIFVSSCSLHSKLSGTCYCTFCLSTTSLFEWNSLNVWQSKIVKLWGHQKFNLCDYLIHSYYEWLSSLMQVAIHTGYQMWEATQCFTRHKRDMLYFIRCSYIVSLYIIQEENIY